MNNVQVGQKRKWVWSKNDSGIFTVALESILDNFVIQYSDKSTATYLRDYISKYSTAIGWTLGRSINGFTLAEGQEWHGTGWTEDKLPPGTRPYIKEEERQAGDQVTFNYELKWGNVNVNLEDEDLPLFDDCLYRTTRPLPAAPAKPKIVPMGQNDYPQGVEFINTNGTRYMPVSINKTGVYFILHDNTPFFYTFAELIENGWRWRTNNGEWQECSKIEEN